MSSSKLPLPVTTIKSAQTLIANKTWQVIDVASVTGSRVSKFDKPLTTPITIPNTNTLKWLSQTKGLDDTADFILKFKKESFDKYKKISITLNNDSLAKTTGLEVANQLYTITDTPVEKEQNGIKLKLISTTTMFGNPAKFTATYYILGINNNFLYLLSPNTMDEEKLVFLLEAK